MPIGGKARQRILEARKKARDEKEEKAKEPEQTRDEGAQAA